jgi:adenine/guanine phosphoribosyltransferase-like PRPP-binding protein
LSNGQIEAKVRLAMNSRDFEGVGLPRSNHIIFRDRRDAGRQLAARLAGFHGRTDVLVLGLARGGVPVAAEVAQALGVPSLDWRAAECQ